MVQTTHDEIRCYANPKAVYASVGLVFILALAGLSGIFSGDKLSTELSVPFSILFVILALWILTHPKSYISVDKTNNTFRSSTFCFRVWDIPISTITRIGTRGTFAGALTIMTITYRKSNGNEKTVNCGSKQTFDKVSLQKVLDALVKINLKLHIPPELRK